MSAADDVWGEDSAADAVWGDEQSPADDVWGDEPSSLADLSGFTPPEETIASLTPEDVDRLTTYAPAAAGLGVSLALPPMAPWAAALTGLGTSAAVRGATPLLQGEGMDAALEEANPLNHPLATAADLGLPFVGKAVSNALRARPVSELADFAKETTLDAALPELDDLATFAQPKTVGRAASTMSPVEAARSRVSAAAPYLIKSKSEAARIAGDRLYSYGELERWVESNGEKIIARATKGLKPVERETLTQVLDGTLQADAVSPRIAAAARTMREQFYDPMGRLAERAGVLTEVTEAGDDLGKWVPFRMRGDYSPKIPIEPKPYVSTDSLRQRLFSRSKVAYQRLDDAEDVPLMTDARDVARSYLGTMKRKIAASHAFGSPTKEGKYGEIGEQLLGQLNSEVGADPLAPALFENALRRVYTSQADDPLGKIASSASRVAAKVQLGKAALRSIPQIGTNIRQHGIGNTIEGLTRYATDPSLRELMETSGAKSASLADHAADLGVGARTIPMRMQRGIERFNRGAANAGIVPQVEKLHAAAQRGPLSSAQERILRELRIDPQELQGELSTEILRRAIQRSADDNQLQATAVGQVGDFAHDQPWKALTQYQPFQWAQWRNFQDRVLSPLAHPIERPAEFGMGLRRAATGLGATAAMSAPVSALYAASAGRDMEPAQFAGDAMETIAGTGGSVGSNLLQGRAPWEPLLPAAPALSIAEQAWSNPEGIPVDVLAALDPTGLAALLRSPLRAYAKEAAR